MSYEIIRSIKIKDNKVFVKADSNNVYPRDFTEREASSLTAMLQKGREALDVYIMEAYEQGSFQKGNNKYTRALKVLRYLPEYKRFDWRNNWKESQKTRGSEEYKELLKKALKTRLPKDKFTVAKDYCGTKVYLLKLTTKQAKWTIEKSRAKIFRYEVEANNVKGCFTNSENWEIEKLN